MTLWPASTPSLDGDRPNPQGRGGSTGEQTRTSRSTANAQRRHLVAIAADRLRGLEAPGDETSDTYEHWRKLHDGWASCGWSTLYRNGLTGTVIGLPDHCDKALCPYDEQRRVGKLRDRYRERHDQALADRRLYLAVLTIPNVALGQYGDACDQLRVAVGKLRRRRWWLDAVAGGLWRLETTVNLTTGTWHPHVNLLFETHHPIRMSVFQPLLQAEWRSAIGAADQQWVWLMPGWRGALPEAIKRQVKLTREAEVAAGDGATSIDYTVKAPKPDWIDAADPAWVIEYVEAHRGRRSVSSFGAWRGLPQPPSSPLAEPTVEAPWAPGEDPFVTRRLPMFDPLRPLEAATPAQWVWIGRGPRWALRPHKPPEEGRAEWLVWAPGDGPDPGAADDDLAFSYAPRLGLARAGPVH